jgi:hypothetical protein
MKRTVLASIAAVLATFALSAARPARAETPFGFERGMTVEQLREKLGVEQVREVEGRYLTPTAPRPNPSFESFGVWFDASGGLCAVLAMGKEYRVDASGELMRRTFDTYHQFFTKKWGAGVLLDKVAATGGAKTWMKALLDGDRLLGALWAPQNAPRLPPELAKVNLTARAVSPQKGQVVILYEFAGTEHCPLHDGQKVDAK